MSEPDPRIAVSVRYIEYRYEGALQNTFSVSVYPAPGFLGRIPRFLLDAQIVDHRLHNRPEWLVPLVDLGRLGAYDVSGHPPQVFILWIHFDKDGEFIEFSKFDDDKELT